jgi:hypothetical protein
MLCCEKLARNKYPANLEVILMISSDFERKQGPSTFGGGVVRNG